METPVSRSYPKPRHGVRVVGKIRPFLESEAARSCPILMTRSGDGHASVFFGDRNRGSKGSSKLDWCYGPEEGVNDVFSKEVKPLLQELLEGRNSCVIAYGAQGSGKTRLIQGTEESPGLALMTVTDIFPVVEELGGLINISCYEVYQDHVYDLLEPKGEVLVMEDANQRIQLKGLSQVPVKSISQFKDLFLHGCDLKTPSQNIANDVTVKSHRGLIVYVSCVDKESKQTVVAKINFVDLAGYEDIKKHDIKSTLAESAKLNKSLYSLLNVVQAVNSNRNYVSYRESKLTRLLQDFISRSTGAVLVTCMSPVACQDTVHAVHLASRSCQMVNQHPHDSIKNSKNASRNVPSCSPMGRVRELDASLKKLDISQFGSIEKKGCGTPSETNRRKPGSAIHASLKKLDISQLSSIEKKGYEATSETNRRPQHLGNSLRKPGSSVHGSIEKINNSSMMKGRKLFNLKSPCIKVDKDVSTVNENEHLKIDDSGLSALKVDAISVNEYNCVEGLVGIGPAIEVDVVSANEHNCVEGTVDIEPPVESKLSSDQHDDIAENSNHNSAFDVAASTTLLTDKLREISNSLKLWSNKPIGISTPQDDQCIRKLTADTVEPQTPLGLCNLDYKRFEDIGTPQDKWRTRSTGLKKSLVQECLMYLNSANKEELKALKGIGEKRATYILELREETPEPFKEVDDLKDLGLSSKQIKGLMSNILRDI